MAAQRNVVLIGMPGAGKSTLGVILAKVLSLPFLDTDIHIQTEEGISLPGILQARGMEGFKRLEERHILSLACLGHVIATGGSAVYSRRAMEHLQRRGTFVFLYLSLDRLERRIRDMDARGIVHAPGQSLPALYEERLPLYRKYADLTVRCDGKRHERIVGEIRATLLKGNLPGEGKRPRNVSEKRAPFP